MLIFQTQIYSAWSVSGEWWAAVDRVGEWNLWERLTENVEQMELVVEGELLLLPQNEEKKEEIQD